MREFVNRRNLLSELVLKDIRIRYRRPILGFLWAFLTPLAMAVIFYIVFGICLKVRIEEAPFFLYLVSALFTWRFFQDSINACVTCLYDNRALLRESRVPQYLIPVSVVLANGLNALPGLVIAAFFSAWALHGVSMYLFLIPLILALHIGMTIGLSVIIAVLYVRWRDIKYLTEIWLMFLFYATPVFYSVSFVKGLLPDYGYRIYMLNPFVCLLTLYRVSFLKGYASFVGTAAIGICLLVACFFAAVFTGIGFIMYRANKRYINEHLSF
ncbi:MAG: hypothetical protein WCY10_02885 [Candidatus Omnitrophota bacterium]